MENIRFIFISIIVSALLGLLIYWAFSTIDSGGEHVSKQELKELRKENEKLLAENEILKKELENFLLAQEEEEKQEEEDQKSETYKYQTMINEIQKLIDANIYMEKGSRGTRVGTVQEFLNLYLETSKSIDNDYGPGTVSDIKKFQSAEKITTDGEAGINTFKKMVEWLRKQ
ncbi:MAG: peptidoglycan-binding protein [Patescibacteria group bacterium]|nr:peptidoglycan-binding protein [Patescibacteria group bacterium]